MFGPPSGPKNSSSFSGTGEGTETGYVYKTHSQTNSKSRKDPDRRIKRIVYRTSCASASAPRSSERYKGNMGDSNVQQTHHQNHPQSAVGQEVMNSINSNASMHKFKEEVQEEDKYQNQLRLLL